MNEEPQEPPLEITGGYVSCVEGLRVWARFLDGDHDILILVKPNVDSR